MILTRARGARAGVRHLAGGLKVYYAPRRPVFGGTSFPGLFGLARLVRCVVLRERVTLLHAHAAFSALACEALLHCRSLGLPCVFTDHSLFGFGEPASVLTNKTLQFALADASHVVCVSHTAKENTVLRARVPPARVSVVPNGLDADRFSPDAAARPAAGVRIVCLQRLVYRKGTDVLAALIPLVLAARPDASFVVGGDGPKRCVLDAMLEAHPHCVGRVALLGRVPREAVRPLLSSAHVFLSPSLTESFGMACLEAASCGCTVVATAVGGVPETLPSPILRLAPPTLAGLTATLLACLDEAVANDGDAQHRRVAKMYSWERTAERTEAAYARAVAQHAAEAIGQGAPLLGRMRRFGRCGAVSGFVFAAVAAADALLMRVLSILEPEHAIDVVP